MLISLRYMETYLRQFIGGIHFAKEAEEKALLNDLLPAIEAQT